ncbi:aromatic-ring-hydroxylating dioxygenase subunit beta [Cupriavidus pinatubonensis]|uniref:Salicylate 5-hydroxylase, small oxygenase component n=1 Tax=Cupriavidus pinatubonensis TaxID=248026 RepID=A0ABM8WBU9_9BURK|nr:aromatic-ring-hydroxylating dioxygenase subunit beta [Cupriavidus pinatubonensis]CAG9164757.1 Salicylate 5-hydroxylase, small oxygenase component [Cupriavidus pinatubonensis]
MNFTDYYALLALHADYTSVVDSGEWDRWPDFFTDDCLYRVQPRENHERGLPLATLSLEGKGMLKDRIYGIRETLFHDPYYQRHIVGTPLIREATGEKIVAETNYAVLRTKPDQMSDVYNVGRYLDTIVRTAESWKFASRLCIFDSEMIPNSLIYPI